MTIWSIFQTLSNLLVHENSVYSDTFLTWIGVYLLPISCYMVFAGRQPHLGPLTLKFDRATLPFQSTCDTKPIDMGNNISDMTWKVP